MNSKYFWRKIIISNKWLNNTVFLFWRLKNYNEKKKILLRSALAIDKVDILTKPLKRCPEDYVLDNSFYGISYSIKEYSHYPERINFYIEHGVYFGSLIHQFERDSYIPNIITSSLLRKTHLEKQTSKHIVTIGPYIHYAKEYMNQESFMNLKQKLGSVLLVFPDHSMTKVNSEFDSTILISTIESLRKDFDSVLICMYWKDILLNRQIDYMKWGYKIVTAGHMLDNNFLSRLKLIINLSDVSISNSVGTHLGYSIYMNKPHTVFKQEIIYTSSDKKYLKYDRSIYNDETWKSRMQELNEVEDNFSDFSFTISVKQRKIVDKYWGVHEIKKPGDLYDSLKKGRR